MTLTAFLLARIADQEKRAREDGADAMTGWRWKHYPREAYEEIQALVLEHSKGVLAECEAKRRIVELHAPLDGGDPEMYPWADDWGNTYWPECSECSERHEQGRGCATLRALALPYAGHPDFREEWQLPNREIDA